MKNTETKKPDLIGPFEQLVLTAIVALGERGYGMAIHAKVSELANRTVRHGAVYMTLERMEEKGYVSWSMADPTPERGGRTRRCYKLLDLGERVLQESVETAKRVQETVEHSWRIGKWRPRFRRAK